MRMPSSRSCIPSSLNHKSDRRVDNLGGLKLKMVCSAVEIKYFLMFIHVYFMLYVNMKRRSVHVFALRQYSDLSRYIEEPQNGIYCLNFFKNDSNLSALSVCTLSVSSLLCDVFFTA